VLNPRDSNSDIESLRFRQLLSVHIVIVVHNKLFKTQFGRQGQDVVWVNIPGPSLTGVRISLFDSLAKNSGINS
jgi:hypothetical protein